jgi:nitrogen fixation protein NifU and related proteins
MENIYKQRILELYSERPNFGELKNKTHEIVQKHPSCNDEIVIQLKVEGDKITDAKFSGKLCFVSMVSAEVLMENIKGMNIEEIKNLSKESIDKFLGTEITSTRRGCELFPLEALKKIKC